MKKGDKVVLSEVALDHGIHTLEDDADPDHAFLKEGQVGTITNISGDLIDVLKMSCENTYHRDYLRLVKAKSIF